MRRSPFVTTGRLVIATALLAPAMAAAQNPPAAAQQAPAVARLTAQPAALTMRAGDTTTLVVTAYDATGKVIPAADAVVRVIGPRTAVQVRGNTVRAIQAGKYDITAQGANAAGQPVLLTIPVTITWPAISSMEIVPDSGRLYVGVTLAHNLRAVSADNYIRKDITATWRSSDPAVAMVDRWGNVTAKKAGAVTISAAAEGVTANHKYTIVANPVASIDVAIKEEVIRTGDVVHLNAVPKRADGSVVRDAPMTWSYTYVPDDSLVSGGIKGGPGIVQFGRFAANYSGRFTLIAQSGNASGRKVIQVQPRESRRKIQVVGRGTLDYVHTSDLWPYTGKDGRDYAVVGTWGGDGWSMFFDITDLNNIKKIDSIKADARTINDVTVSPDARYAVLSREGASNRVNGIVIVDLADPKHPKVASTFDQNLTGGVHNIFATNDHIFAISGGQKYVIIDVKDITKPKYVSEYEHPGARIHDLWVNNGIAYSAQGGAGTVVVDVGNGKYGGTIEKPKLITVYQVNSGHEIFPYFQKSTGKTYLFIGDEEMSRTGRVWEGTQYSLSGPDGKPPRNGIAQTSGGFTHIIDFTDPMHPIPVGRYHLEDYGSHDIIVQDDILYQAYYDGGVRLVDVSGELMGNLADQNREIAVFKSYDPTGYTPNAPFVMNAMPWKKDFVLFTDFNSGLWAAKVQPKTNPVP
jgi:hypothetical protein